jgi:hypothetical protein
MWKTELERNNMATNGEAENHCVLQGETTESIAFHHGHAWQTVWDHPANAELKRLRVHHNVLAPGDTLFVPARTSREEQCATTRVHTFRRRGVPSPLLLRCLNLQGEPRAGEPWRISQNGTSHSGTLDNDGWLRTTVAPNALDVLVIVGKEGTAFETHYQLHLGHLDPLDSVTGLCDRLRNLGYDTGASKPTIDHNIRAAIARFRSERNLPSGDHVDDALLASIEQLHGV